MHYKDFCGFAGLRHTACVCCVARREGNYPFPSTYITYSLLPGHPTPLPVRYY
jgi:hypothetical protein